MNTKSTKKGIACCIGCSVIWGILPIYWQSLRPVSSEVIIFYRIFLVGLICFIMSFKIYGIDELKRPLKKRKSLLLTVCAGILITLNWSIYIWAVNAEHVIQTCIGYYIEPLMVCVFGIIIFKEKLDKSKFIAFSFAISGLLILLFHFKEVPGIAIGLAVTFAAYAALKKKSSLPGLISLFYETLFLMPVSLAFILYFEINGKGALGNCENYQFVLLLLCGILTALPLGLFSYGARHCPLTTLGLLEYLSPSIALVLGVFVLGEPFDIVQFISFAVIWIGLIFFTAGEFNLTKK